MPSWPLIQRAVQRLLPTQSPVTKPVKPSGDKTIIVRRGMSEDFYFFLEVFAKHNSAAMVVDRRAADRRHFSREAVKERRHASDRRADSPNTWTKDHFVVRRHPSPKES